MMKSLRLLACVLALSSFAAAGARAGATDGDGRVWTPDGEYVAGGGFTTANLSSDGKKSSLDAGNGCFLEGTLSPVKNEPAYVFTVAASDGVACPQVKTIKATIVDGPAVRAQGNAATLRLFHPAQKNKIDFSGVYTFKY